jgi:hypothetical protein
MPIIARYIGDDGAEPQLCERAILTSGTKCTATVVLCDENGESPFFMLAPCRPTFERQSRLARMRGYRVGFNYGCLYERLGVCWLADASGNARANACLTICDSWMV